MNAIAPYTAAEKSQGFLQSIYTGSDVAIFVIDVTPERDFRFAGINPTHERLSGMASEWIQGKTPEELVPAIPPEAAAAIRANYACCLDAGHAIEYEEMIPMQGRDTWWLTRLTPLSAENGSIYRIIGTSTAINRLKATESELRDYQERLEELVNERTRNLNERLKELRCLYRASTLMADSTMPEADLMQALVTMLPAAWQFPQHACARIVFDHREFLSGGDAGTEDCAISADIAVAGEIRGRIVVGYRAMSTEAAEDPFLPEEHELLHTLARELGHALERRQTQQHYGAILHTAIDGFWMCDTQGRLQDVNAALCRMLGYTREELLQMSVQELEAQESTEETADHIRQVMRDGSAWFETRHRRKDGTVFDVEISTTYLPGDGGRFFVFARDITARKHAEENLTRQHRQVLALLDGIEDVIYVADPHTYELLHVNAAFIHQWGNNVAGKRCYEVLQHRQAPCPFCTNGNIFGDNLGTPYIWEFQNEVTRRWYRCADKAIQWVDGRWVRFEQATDITERKWAEMELERLNTQLSQKNTELEQVVYVTSHDLRSPLVNVQGFSKELQYAVQDLRDMLNGAAVPDALRQDVMALLEGDIGEDLHYILTSIAKMDTLLAGLLKLSRLGRAALTIEPLDMNALIAQVVAACEFQIKEAGVSLDVAPLPPCRGDVVQINQVFSNLLANALKYRDPERDGQICIRGSEAPDQDQVVYCVEDNGIGIAPEHQPKIFEIFHRLNPALDDGEGLGLTIVHRVLERQNGRVWVESAAGEGSRFFVSLPKARE